MKSPRLISGVFIYAAAWCLGRGCNHFHILDVSGYPDGLPVLSFGPRLRCERCGHLGADARPNRNDMHKQEPITQASSVARESPLCPQ